jgi:hypothetical protein
MSKSNRTSSAANAFGAGSDLVGMSHKGHEIVSASRQYMHLDNGETVVRAGNRVEHERFVVTGEVDNTAYMTDDL